MLFNEVGQPQTTYTPGPATMGEGSPHPSPLSLEPHQFNVPLHQQQQAPRIRRKRKADHQDAHNERLSKRMSLLNLGMFAHSNCISLPAYLTTED